jgi:hypothetical protein
MIDATLQAQTDPARKWSVQLLVPVYNEGENVRTLYNNLKKEKVSFDSLMFVYDFDGDSTVPVISELMREDSKILLEKNQFGRGVLNALRWGFSKATQGPVIVVMADNSDKLSIIPDMIVLWEKGATVVAPSRYMKGGKQYGGGVVKSTLSRLAGVSLKLLGFPTADPTNNFKLYDGAWLATQKIESVGGFEVALELSTKAYEQKRNIVELPTEWRDRTLGQSNFKLFSWLPRYLRWYFRALKSLITQKA